MVNKESVIPPVFQAQTWLKVFHLRYETKQKQLSHGVYQVFVSNRLKIFIGILPDLVLR